MAMDPRLLRPRATGIASPLVIPGCIGWYDSADTDTLSQNSDGTGEVSAGSQVGYWADKSTTGAHVTQAVAANRPTLTAEAVNGRTALVFDGSNDNLSHSSYTAQNNLAGLTRVIVWGTQFAAMAGRVFDGGSDQVFTLSGGYISSYAASLSGVRAAATAAPVAVYASVFDGGGPSMSLYINGTQPVQSTIGTLPATTGGGTPTLHIGSNIGANLFTSGPVAEYIVFARALTAGELSAVTSYLMTKWGFA